MLPMTRLLAEKVEYIVQVDISPQRAYPPTLNRTYLTRYPSPLLHHTCSPPFADETHDAPVGYPVLDLRLPHAAPEALPSEASMGPPGSRARCFRTCSRSTTVQGPNGSRVPDPSGVAFRSVPQRRNPGL